MESNKTECKVCKALKDRIEDGRFPDGRNKRWKDETGKLWNGYVCGVCNKNRSLDAMKKLRAEHKALMSEADNDK